MRRARLPLDGPLIAVVASAALLPRLLAVVLGGGGGLFGHLGYDGTVYYAAAVGLIEGRLPYRDTLLLHPPGIVLALLPFAGLGGLIGDPMALAVGRLTWMGLGALSAVLVATVLRPYGRVPALVGGLTYAVLVPAVWDEHSTTLEGLGSVCLIGAVALLAARPDIRPSAFACLAAGGLLGLAASTKIWYVAVALAPVGWLWVRYGRRAALQLIAGLTCSVILFCLPFFVAAPQQMWRMVVADQFGRPRQTPSVSARLLDIVGLPGVVARHPVAAALVVATAVAAAVLAARIPVGRLALALLGVCLPILLLSPPWSLDYGGLTAPVVALILGSATAALIIRDRVPGVDRPAQLSDRSLPSRSVAIGLVLLIGLSSYVVLAHPGRSYGHRFPGTSLAAVLGPVPGCITTDDPELLVATDLLRRNLARGCPLVVDLGGYSYDLRPSAAAHRPRTANKQWQHQVVDYLSTGQAAVIVRFVGTPGLSRATVRTIEGWPVIGQVGPYVVRRPPERRPS
ncbi:MAG TPA: hypothetical protein VFP34_09330 [Microlunatus sp.]|nr:hypothetical protein [Microlunatus sp.]